MSQMVLAVNRLIMVSVSIVSLKTGLRKMRERFKLRLLGSLRLELEAGRVRVRDIYWLLFCFLSNY